MRDDFTIIGAPMPLSRSVARLELAGLDAFEVAVEEAELTVALLHGYGADGTDLLPLAAEIPTRRRCRWLFLEAPHPLPGAGRAWFPLDERKLFEVQQAGGTLDFSPEDPPGLREASKAAAAALRESGADPARLVVGGFSQGSMVAADLLLESKKAPAGLIVLSGNLIAEERWRRLAPARAGLPFFQSHGREDGVLGFDGAVRLERLLRDGGLKGSLLAFDGPHTIPSEAVHALGAFLDGLA